MLPLARKPKRFIDHHCLIAYRCRRDIEPLGDTLIGESACNELSDLLLSWSQIIQRFSAVLDAPRHMGEHPRFDRQFTPGSLTLPSG